MPGKPVTVLDNGIEGVWHGWPAGCASPLRRGLRMFAGGFVSGGKMTTWLDVAPLETEVDEPGRRRTS